MPPEYVHFFPHCLHWRLNPVRHPSGLRISPVMASSPWQEHRGTLPDKTPSVAQWRHKCNWRSENGEREEKASYKVMVACGEQTYTLLSEEARARGITIQERLRAVVIPDWFKAKYEPVPRQSPIIERRTREEDPVVPYSFSNKLRY